MDQTPLPFVLGGWKMYEFKGASLVWVQGGQSGLDKRQCTVQLTIVANGEPRVKPLILFRGTGCHISKQERNAWNSRVQVYFQKKAWCDETVMNRWINEMWESAIRSLGSNTLLVADVHKAQKTKGILTCFKEIATTPALVPAGSCTCLIQPLDEVFNNTFKAKLSDLFNQHMQVCVKINASVLPLP